MNIQKLLFKVEELKALAELYEQTATARAKGTAMVEAFKATPEHAPEELTMMEEQLGHLGQRVETLEKLLCTAIGAADVEEAAEKLHQHIARVDQFHRLRSELANLKVSLELEIALGTISTEQRREAEAAAGMIQQRLEVLTLQGNQAFPGPKLITV